MRCSRVSTSAYLSSTLSLDYDRFVVKDLYETIERKVKMYVRALDLYMHPLNTFIDCLRHFVTAYISASLYFIPRQ
jgi:hypothetical protein